MLLRGMEECLVLLRYRFRNFRSFAEEAEFDLAVDASEKQLSHTQNYVESAAGVRVLKSAVIVGENAGGKSNFIKSLKYIKDFFKENRRNEPQAGTPFLADIPDKEHRTVGRTRQSFSFDVLIDGEIYTYQLAMDVLGIYREELSIRSRFGGEAAPIFRFERRRELPVISEETMQDGSRDYSVNLLFRFGASTDIPMKTQEYLQTSIEKDIKNGLVISKLSLLGEKHAKAFVGWMLDTLQPEEPFLGSYALQQWQSKEVQPDEIRIMQSERFLEIFRMVDSSISGIEVNAESPYQRTLVTRSLASGGQAVRALKDDSDGVKEFFAWAVQIYRVVYEDKVVFADEMDHVLNPILSDRVISFINGMHHKGQFVFTTHNVLHLNLNRLMKEQIYFITKDKETLASELYSLADFPEVSYEEPDVYDFYMHGLLGGTGDD